MMGRIRAALLALIGTVIFGAPALAQSTATPDQVPGGDGGAGWLSWERVSLRQSFQSTRDKAEPASFGLSAPRGADDTYAITAALGYNITPDDWWAFLEFSPFVEFHRNSDQKNEQNLFLAGTAADWTVLDPVSSCKRGRLGGCWTPVVDAKLNYRLDEINDTEGLQAAVLTTLFISRAAFSDPAAPPKVGEPPPARWLWNHISPVFTPRGFELLRLEYNPYLGFEYDGAYSVKSDSALSSGSAVRAVGRLKITFDLLPSVWEDVPVIEGIQLVGDGFVRQDLSDSIEYDGGPFYPYGKVSLNLDVYRQKKDGEVVAGGRSSGLGLDYINGEDPAKAFVDQQLFRLTFKTKF